MQDHGHNFFDSIYCLAHKQNIRKMSLLLIALITDISYLGIAS